jgi:hypothetical protein
MIVGGLALSVERVDKLIARILFLHYFIAFLVKGGFSDSSTFCMCRLDSELKLH